MKRIGLALVMAVGLLSLGSPGVFAQGDDTNVNAVRVTGAAGFGAGAWGAVFGVEYERYLGNGFGLAARPRMHVYGYEDGDYTEDGVGYGVDIGGRYYFAREDMSKFYIGVALGYFVTNWDWEESNGYHYSGDGDSGGIHFGAEFGYRFLMAEDRFSITPAVFVGDFLSVSSDDDESEFGFYAGFGVSFGFHF